MGWPLVSSWGWLLVCHLVTLALVQLFFFLIVDVIFVFPTFFLIVVDEAFFFRWPGDEARCDGRVRASVRARAPVRVCLHAVYRARASNLGEASIAHLA